jgi:hypothetical protein
MPQMWGYCTVTHQGNKAKVDFFALGGSANYRSEDAGRFNMFEPVSQLEEQSDLAQVMEIPAANTPL